MSLSLLPVYMICIIKCHGLANLFYFITYSFSQGCTIISLKTKQKIKDHTSVCSCVRITKRFDRNQSGALLDENPRFIASRKSSLPAFLTTTTTVLYKEYM